MKNNEEPNAMNAEAPDLNGKELTQIVGGASDECPYGGVWGRYLSCPACDSCEKKTRCKYNGITDRKVIV